MRRLRIALATTFLGTALLVPASAPAQWVNKLTFTGRVDDMLAFQGSLFVVGNFGGTNHCRMFRANETVVFPPGLDDSYGKNLAVHGDSLYAAGTDLHVWNGSAWVVRWDAPYPVQALTSHRDTLVVCLASPEGQPRLYRPEGAGWVPYLPQDMLGSVYSMASYGGDLYVGGSLTRVGSLYVRGIARWDGTAWRRLGAGADNGAVFDFAFHDGNLVVHGSFTTAGPYVARGLARWDGSAWGIYGGPPGPVTSWFSPRVYGATAYGSDLVIGGDFEEVNGVPANGVAVWRNGAWYAAPFPGGLEEGGVMAFFRQAVWADLRPTYTGPPITRYIAKWTGQVTGIAEVEPVSPGPVRVSPNPFRTATTVTIDAPWVPREARVLDVRGREVRRLEIPAATAGPWRLTWDGRTGQGSPSPAGVYFLRVDHAAGRETARLLLLR